MRGELIERNPVTGREAPPERNTPGTLVETDGSCAEKREKLRFREAIYGTETGRSLFALLLTAALFILVSQFSPRVFYINDDENIMYTLSGYYTNGVPYDHSFINFCLSYVLRLLYRLVPGVQWYGVFHLCLMGLSIAAVFKTVAKISLWKELPFFVPVLVDLALFGSLYLFPSTIMQFTTTSAFAGAAAVATLLGMDWRKDSCGQQIYDLLLSGLLLLLCYMHRKNSGYVAFCFYFGTALLQLIRALRLPQDDRWRKAKRISSMRRLMTGVVTVTVLLVAVFGIDLLKRSGERWDSFIEYDNARFKMLDYPHASYSEDPELYDSLGWSPELYELAARYWWFFMDSRINVESFNAISQTGFYNQEGHSLHATLQVAANLFKTDPLARLAMLISGGLALLLPVLLLLNRWKKDLLWDFLYGICMVMGTAVLCLFLCYRQRLPLRALHAILIPFVSLCAVLLLQVTPQNRHTRGRAVLRTAVCLLLAAVTLLLGCFNLEQAITQGNDRVEKSNRTLLIEQYAMDHKDTLFVYDVSLTFRYLPFTVYRDNYPSNLMFWGGMGWKSPAFYQQISDNGLHELYSDVMFRDDMLYITRDSYVAGERTMRDRFEAYMDATYGDCDFILVDDLGDGIHVYQIRKAN